MCRSSPLPVPTTYFIASRRLALLYAVVRSVNGFCEPDPTDKPPPPTSPPTQPLTSRPITSARRKQQHADLPRPCVHYGVPTPVDLVQHQFPSSKHVIHILYGPPTGKSLHIMQERLGACQFFQGSQQTRRTPSARPNRSVTEKTEISLRNNRYTTPVKDKPPMAAPRPRLRQ
uniref:Uncharacterized protein n=1 Tax=Vespula pensylvanica TaxID=30213 RepID=A0A834NZF2_VESPE|nr:hypothetical protein H0235_009509 [Vespula pensylvanica]